MKLVDRVMTLTAGALGLIVFVFAMQGVTTGKAWWIFAAICRHLREFADRQRSIDNAHTLPDADSAGFMRDPRFVAHTHARHLLENYPTNGGVRARILRASGV